MTKQDYKLIADQLASRYSYANIMQQTARILKQDTSEYDIIKKTVEQIETSLAIEFYHQNPRFDFTKWELAVYGNMVREEA